MGRRLSRSRGLLLLLGIALTGSTDVLAAADPDGDAGRGWMSLGRTRQQVRLGFDDAPSSPPTRQQGHATPYDGSGIFDSNGTMLESASRLDPSSSPLHTRFHDYGAIASILRSFALSFPRTELFSVGKTAEDRDIWALRVLPSERTEPDELKEFVVVGGQHAREWISTSTVIYLLHQRLLYPPSGGDDAGETGLAYTFIPVANPDGYAYTWTDDRLWRKNRQKVDLSAQTDGAGEQRFEDPECVGLDLNRNWGYHFLPPRRTPRPNPCSDSFPGMRAFEALETAALARYLLGSPETSRSPARRVLAFLDLHAYGQQLLFPYAYTCARQPPAIEDLWEAGFGAAKALRMVHGRRYEVGGRCDVSYAAPGDAIDWTYGGAGIKWSFAAELRDFGTWGFLLPPDQIVPQGQEALAMVQSLADFVAQKEKL